MEEALNYFNNYHLNVCLCGNLACKRNLYFKEQRNAIHNGMGLYGQFRFDPDDFVFYDLIKSIKIKFDPLDDPWSLKDMTNALHWSTIAANKLIMMGVGFGLWQIETPYDYLNRDGSLCELDTTNKPQLIAFMINAGYYGVRQPNNVIRAIMPQDKAVILNLFNHGA